MSRQNPMDDFGEWFRQLNDQLEEASRRWGGGSMPLGSGGHQPDVDLIDRGEEFVVTIDLPGYTKESVTVRLSDRTLFVDAEREGVEETETEGDETYLRMERTHESISRSLRLPEPVDPEDVTARMNNGVLTITLAKADPGSMGESIDIE